MTQEETSPQKFSIATLILFMIVALLTYKITSLSIEVIKSSLTKTITITDKTILYDNVVYTNDISQFPELNSISNIENLELYAVIPQPKHGTVSLSVFLDDSIIIQTELNTYILLIQKE